MLPASRQQGGGEGRGEGRGGEGMGGEGIVHILTKYIVLTKVGFPLVVDSANSLWCSTLAAVI